MIYEKFEEILTLEDLKLLENTFFSVYQIAIRFYDQDSDNFKRHLFKFQLKKIELVSKTRIASEDLYSICFILTEIMFMNDYAFKPSSKKEMNKVLIKI